MKFPCKDCEKRYIGCHSKCGEYMAAAEKHRKAQEADRGERMAIGALYENYLARRSEALHVRARMHHSYH